MLEEFNHDLAAHCEDVYSEMMGDIIDDLLKIFVYRAIPEGNPECEDYIDYLGKLVYTGHASLKAMPELNYEAGQFSRQAVADLTPAERFIIEAYYAEFLDKMPTDEDIHVGIMEFLDNVLYDIGNRVVNGE